MYMYRISRIFRVGLIFAEFATSLKSPKNDTVKNKPYYTSLLRVLEIAKIGLSENLTHLSSVIFAKISPMRKFPIYGIFIYENSEFVSGYLPTYPGVPHAVAIIPESSVFDRPKSLIIILESASGL